MCIVTYLMGIKKKCDKKKSIKWLFNFSLSFLGISTHLFHLNAISVLQMMGMAKCNYNAIQLKASWGLSENH